LRYADNWVSKRGYKIEEFDVSAWESEVEAVSESWRGSRTIRRKEVRFLNRPIVMEDEPGVRRFGLFSTDQRLEAFIFFDPLFLGDQINGYVTCIKRRLPAANGYLESAIMKRAIEVFKSEAVPYIWLGLSPFANIQNQEFRCNRPLDWISRYSYSSNWFNRYLYNFKGHSEYKRRYQGEEFKVYYASRSRTNVLRLMTLASLCGAF
jgi:phosphatidylglycerol lysyltransferase